MDLFCCFQMAVVHIKAFIVTAKGLVFYMCWIFRTGCS